jgi:hypothetical protein
MAKKAKKAKKAKAKKSAGTARKIAKRGSSAKKTAKRSAKKAAPKPRPTRASKTKVAARSAAGRSAESPGKHAQKERAQFQKTSTIGNAAKVAAGVALLAYDEVVKRLPWAHNENDPIALLKTDHRRFENLLKQGEDTTERARQGRREILNTLTDELNVHEAIEEKILYPALRPHAEAHDIVLEGFQEHHVADMVLKELHEVATNDEQWGAKFKVFKENVEHHISEEENKMFPVARGVLKKEELLALGKKMRELKADLEK